MDRDPHLSPNSEALSDAHKIYELFIHVNTRIFLNSTDFYSPAISLLFNGYIGISYVYDLQYLYFHLRFFLGRN